MSHKGLSIYFGLLSTSILFFGCDQPEEGLVLAPKAEVVVNPLIGLTTTFFSMDGSLSKAGNPKDKIFFRWDWNGDGLWDTKYSSEPVSSHRFYSSGNHQVVLEVLNSSGLTDTCLINLNVKPGYSAPKAKFYIDPPIGNLFTRFIFDGSLTKDDEDSLNQLTFRWDWEGDNTWDTGFNSDYLVLHSYNDLGTFHPALEVKDPSGFISFYQTDLEVSQTNPRLQADFKWSPLYPLQLDSVTLDASESMDLDNPDNQLIYYWMFSFETPLNHPDPKTNVWFGPFTSPVFIFKFLEERDYWITLRIVDSKGLENKVIRKISVFHLNRPPTPGIQVSTNLGNLTTNFFFDARNTTDIEDLYSELKVRWDFDGDNLWDTEYQADKTTFYRYNSVGVYRVMVEAIDTEGLTGRASLLVKVTPGTSETGLVIDRRFDHDEYYPTVKIGDQWWMSKNMNYSPNRYTGKIDTMATICYNNDPGNCDKIGGLYTAYWATLLDMEEGAQGICPTGWHIPTKGEWEIMLASFGENFTSEELVLGGSTDFNALFAGYAYETLVLDNLGRWGIDWIYAGLGSITYFWSSTPLKGQGAASHWNVTLIKGAPKVSTGYSGDANFYSVRCIKNQ
jgi:uncharacterized protein (TIGR02145 family)